jgi:N-acylglucosamine-6-phosphate 2-epimerase
MNRPLRSPHLSHLPDGSPRDLNRAARKLLDTLEGGIVVSCQARPGNPLEGSESMAIVARAAELGGARALRINGVADIVAVRRLSDLPVMGILKEDHDDSPIMITPTVAAVRKVLAAGAPIVALDGTNRYRPGGETLGAAVREIHRGRALAFADLATREDLHHAVAADVDAVGTTLSGYTAESPKSEEPDFDLLAWLVKHSPVPVFAEGRFWTPDQAAQAFALGAAFVVIGTAITNPMAITSRFVAETARSVAAGNAVSEG